MALVVVRAANGSRWHRRLFKWSWDLYALETPGSQSAMDGSRIIINRKNDPHKHEVEAQHTAIG